MNKSFIVTPDAPEAIGTYSQAVKTGQTTYLSGQIPLKPDTMEVVSGDIEAEIRQAFHNLQAVCVAGGREP
jgi:Putative translation initiation inhibitor, yjgF family